VRLASEGSAPGQRVGKTPTGFLVAPFTRRKCAAIGGAVVEAELRRFFQRDEWIEFFLSRDVCEKYVASRMNIKEVIDIPPITFIKEPIDVAI
jgi:hypothetical protein